jgi:hypothetical protein
MSRGRKKKKEDMIRKRTKKIDKYRTFESAQRLSDGTEEVLTQIPG